MGPERAECRHFGFIPFLPTPVMQHAAHPVTTEVPPGYDGTTSRLKPSDVAKRRGPAIAARLSGRAELFKERLDRDSLKDPETGVEYLLSTLRPYYLVKDGQSVFFYRFFQMLRCNRGQSYFQRWMVKYEIARQKAVDAWLDIPRPDPAGAVIQAEVDRLRQAARVRLRAEARQTYVGAPDGLQAHVNAVGLPAATDAMSDAALETVWRTDRRARVDQFPISNNLSALMGLVMADLCESQRETLMNLIFQ